MNVYLEKLAPYVNLQATDLQIAILSIIAAPLIWNLLARLEYYTHILTKLACGNKYLGCYALAIYIFSFSAYRDYLVDVALNNQPTHPLLQNEIAQCIGYVLMGIGAVFVLSSFYQLGITGTYLGDYFGILMDERVTAFPFSVLDNPMYDGSTMIFLGRAITRGTPAGILCSVIVWLMYRIALLLEGPFTAKIYAEKSAKEAKKKK